MSGKKLTIGAVVAIAVIVVTAGILLALTAPSGFTGTATGIDSIEWTWTDTNHDPDNENGFEVYDATNHTVLSIPSILPDITSWIEDTGLSENTQYERYVKAKGTSGGGEDVDQECSSGGDAYYSVYASQTIGQSFTVGVTGTLTKIEVGVKRATTSTNSITIELRNNSGGLPGGLVNGNCSVTRSDFPMSDTGYYWNEVTFPSTVSVVSGEIYWIVLKSSTTSGEEYGWAGAGSYVSGTYPNGNGAVDAGAGWGSASNYDFYFRSYVDEGSSTPDSDPSNNYERYTLVHDPVWDPDPASSDFEIFTTMGSLDVTVKVDPPPNQDADLTAVQIRRDVNLDMSTATIIKPFTDPLYTYIDTVPASGTYYYGITFRNGDGIETTEAVSGEIDVIGELDIPANFTGIGTAIDKILWEWTDDVIQATGYVLLDETGINVIAMITRPGESYEETVGGENTPATRLLSSAVFATTSLMVDQDSTGTLVWPWHDLGRHMQFLYTAAELSNQRGSIRKVYWYRSYAGASQTYQDVAVLLGHTTNTELGTGFAANFTEGDSKEVRAASQYVVPVTAGNNEWVEIPISDTDTFFYNGSNNLVLDMNITSGTTDLRWTVNGGIGANTALYAPPGTGTSGNQWDKKYFIKFDVDTIESMSVPATCADPPAYSLVHDAVADDFDLALGAGPGEVVVTVIEPPNAYADMTGVKIERALSSDFSDTTTVQDFTANYTFNDSGLAAGSTYHYRITYCNGDGVPSTESSGEWIEIPPESNAPVADITDPTGGIYSGDVTITYSLTDPTSDLCTITAEYRVATGSWNPCNEAGGDGTANLTSSDTGVTHTFIWGTVANNVGISGPEAVEVRITPSDVELGTADTTAFTVSQVGNIPPVASITSPTGGTLSGDIQIDYTLADTDGDTCDTTIDYTTDGGMNWTPCTQGTGGEAKTGLSTTTLGDPHTFIWDSLTDGVGLSGDQSVLVRVVPTDKDGTGTQGTASFTVNNVPQEAPTVTITYPTGGETEYGDVTVSYTLFDRNSDSCSITVEYTDDGGLNWYSCAQGTGGDGTSGLTASDSGVSHTFVWDTVANGVGTTAPEDVQVRITPDDGVAGTPDTSSQFTVDNTGPEPVNADFVADTTSGPASLTVNFTDLSTGTFDSWLWDFGDGYTSTTADPTHIYRLVGTYTVRLTIDGPEGSDMEEKVGYINVTDPLTITADFNATPTSGAPPLDVNFTDLSVGAVSTWSWDFDSDGFNDSTQQHPSHTYANTGLYTVTLTITGSAGSDTETKTGYISVTSGTAAPGKKKSGGCSCTVDAGPTPASTLFGYFLPALLLACAYLALRRRVRA